MSPAHLVRRVRLGALLWKGDLKPYEVYQPVIVYTNYILKAYLELSMVVEARRGIAAIGELEALIADLHIDIHPFDATQARRAILAWRQFGKGRHLAGLNLGDVCTFAASVDQAEPILFKGDDFTKTDCSKMILME